MKTPKIHGFGQNALTRAQEMIGEEKQDAATILLADMCGQREHR